MRTFSCDIETDGIDATKVWCIAVHSIDTDQVITFAGPCLNLFKPWLESEADCLIFHNGISFDVPVLEKLLDVDFSGVQIEDTLVMSQLYKPRLDGGHSLSSWGDRLGFAKGDYDDWSKFTDEMLQYCIRDTKVTTKVYKYLVASNLSDDAKELEYAIKKQCSLQERTGWFFDLHSAIKLLVEINDDLRLAEEEVHKTFVPLAVWKSKKAVSVRFTKDNKRTKHYQAEVELGCHTNEKGDYGYWTYPELNLGSRQQVG